MVALRQEDIEKVKQYIEAAREKGEPIEVRGIQKAMLEHGIGAYTINRIMEHLGYRKNNP